MIDKRLYIIAVSTVTVLLVAMTIAFAALASNLNISFGDVTQNALTWSVGFKGSSITPTTEGTSSTGLSCGIATVTPSTVTIADSTLSKPDDRCTYPLTIENTGDISANLSAIAMSQPTNMTCTKPDDSTMVCGNITIKLKTESGTDFSAGVTIEPGEEYDLTLIIQYTGETLNSVVTTLNSSKVTFTYMQSSKRVSNVKPDGIKDAPKTPICKRATSLHTEECTRDSAGCYSSGYSVDGSKGTTTITYGSLGTSGTLSVGDAFDCDVNGDGDYDATTERFYYLSGVNGDANSDDVALIYYSNINGNVADPYKGIAYDSADISTNGPVDAYKLLPTTEQWPNVSLLNDGKRQLYMSNGKVVYDDVTLPVFEYKDKAARLIDYRELESACNVIFTDSPDPLPSECYFIVENTNFAKNYYLYTGIWLESLSRFGSPWAIMGAGFSLSRHSATNTTNGARPVIEVNKSYIAY